MNNINIVLLIGNLTADAELKYTTSGMAVARFSIASNHNRKMPDGQYVDEVSFFEVNLFGKSAENLCQYLTKGKQIGLQGELRQDRWEQDGQTRSKVFIVASNVELLGGKREDNQGQYANQYQQRNSQQNYQQHGKPVNDAPNMPQFPPQNYDAQMEFPEEIPF